MCKETVVAYFKALFRISKTELNKTTKNLSGGTNVEIRNKHLQNAGQKQYRLEQLVMFHTCF
jgi:hypothetical protein